MANKTIAGNCQLFEKKRWLIKKHPALSLRRIFGLWALKLKRFAGYDISFNPPAQGNFEKIDVFMPTIEKDLPILEDSVVAVRTFSLNPIDKIFIVGPKNSNKIKKAATRLSCSYICEEDVLGFPKEKINYFFKGYTRNGWIYKMLLNLYCDEVSDKKNILVLDSDTIFIASQAFVINGVPLFNLSDEYHFPYYIANERILGIKHKISRSFITHYMLFNREALKRLRQFIEKKHHKIWYEAIIDSIYRESGSGFADYEIYGDFYTQIYKRPFILNYWSNKSYTINNKSELNDIIKNNKKNYRSVSFHFYKEKF